MADDKVTEGTVKAITDRELLAICNLTNLRLEFADLAKDRDEKTGKILSNHTIYSILYDEKESILSDNKSADKKKRRVFFDLDNEDDQDNPKIPLYKDLETFKGKAGMVYEYFEKYSYGVSGDNFDESKGNSEGAFTKDWKILYAGDGYKIASDFFNYIYHPSLDTLYATSKLKIISRKDIIDKIKAKENAERMIKRVYYVVCAMLQIMKSNTRRWIIIYFHKYFYNMLIKAFNVNIIIDLILNNYKNLTNRKHYDNIY
jgi:hypothetical protein